MGIGHIRRNLLITENLISRQAASDVLMISGSQEAAVVPAKPGIDHLTIPGLRRHSDGTYAARSMHMDTDALIALRSETIGALLRSFEPDLLIVDKKPRGVLGELDPVLRSLRETGKTKIVLGLRDVLDDPQAVAAEWSEGDYGTILNEFYDAVWVYGDRSVYDLTAEARMPESVSRRFEFTGYLDQRTRLGGDDKSTLDALSETGLRDAPFVLCMVGGGEDGMQVAESFARAELPRDWHGVLVAGPFMPKRVRHALHQLAAAQSRLHVVDYVNEPITLINASERVVCMGGYGASTEVVSLEKPALVVPRVRPRIEQLIRAERFAQLGLVDYLNPERLTPDALTAWIHGDTRAGKDARMRIDLGGLKRIPRMVGSLLCGRGRTEAAHHREPREDRAGRRTARSLIVPTAKL